MARRKAPIIADELLDQLLAGRDPQSALGKDGLVDELRRWTRGGRGVPLLAATSSCAASAAAAVRSRSSRPSCSWSRSSFSERRPNCPRCS